MKKTFDIFKDYLGKELRIRNEVQRFTIGCSVLIGGMELCIFAEECPWTSSNNNVHGFFPERVCLSAQIRWYNTSINGDVKFFDLSNDGIHDACEWLDTMRCDYVQQLLNGIIDM